MRTPSSHHTDDLDPAVERVIERCLEADPTNRPGSALAVAAALPGGDPLAAALAAGETPSPEMVAASGGAVGLRPAVAGALLAFIVLSLVLAFMIPAFDQLSGQLPLRPEFLARDAQEMLDALGHRDPETLSRGVAYGFRQDPQTRGRLEF